MNIATQMPATTSGFLPNPTSKTAQTGIFSYENIYLQSNVQSNSHGIDRILPIPKNPVFCLIHCYILKTRKYESRSN